MSEDVNTAQVADLPFYITPMGGTDTLMIFMIVFLLALLVFGGVFYLHLHSVPDRMAHKANNTQLQLIGILTLIALVTHNNVFWIAAIILAALNPPDLMTPIQSMARSLQRMSGGTPQGPEAVSETAPASSTSLSESSAHKAPDHA